MAREKSPNENTLEREPEEYRIVLKRKARAEDVEDLGELFSDEDTNDVKPEDIFWEGSVDDLKTANLWEVAGLVPAIDADWYQLEKKTSDNDFELVGTFIDEADYDDTIDKVTQEPASFFTKEKTD